MGQPVTKKIVRYQPHLISYVDILGFKEIVEDRTAGFISKIIRTLQEATRPLDIIRKVYDTRYQNFSDLCVVATPIRDAKAASSTAALLYFEIRALANAQASLSSEGIVLRGAITVGPLVKSYNVLYGPGLVTAYQAEQLIAKYPRVVVTTEALRALEDDVRTRHEGPPGPDSMESIEELLRIDEKGVRFIDYLRIVESEMDVPEQEYPELLQQHKALIEANLYKFRAAPRVRAKYEWLREYHDTTVSRRLSPEDVARYVIAPDVNPD